MRMIAIHAQTERKRLDRSVRCAEKRRPWARKQRLRGLIRPDPAVCATAGAACGRKSLSSARIQAIFTSNDTPLGECRLQRLGILTKESCRTSPFGHSAPRLSAEGFPCLAFGHPVLPTEGNNCDKDAVPVGVDKTWGSCRAFSVCDGQPTIENCGPCDGYSVSPFGRPPHPSALSHAGICNVID